MSLEYEAGRLQTCGLSLREILVGSLLAMDEALRLLREDDVEIMARLVAEMCVAMNDNTTPTAELAYGVPLWLIGTIDRPERSRGLGAFLWSVYNGGGKWKALFQKIIPYIDDLQTLHALLSKGPYPTPRERYEQLRTLAAIGNDGKIRYPRLRASASRRERSEQTAVAELATRDQDPVLADLGGRLGQALGETREDSQGVALEHPGLVGVGQGRALDVAFGVVVVEAAARIDPTHRADHLRTEQDVFDGDHVEQKVDARLVVDAGVEEDVVQQAFFQRRPLHVLRQPAITAPVIGNRPAAVRNDDP